MKKSNIEPQPTFHVKKNDVVVVRSGVHKGSRGKILQVLRTKNRVLIEGVNLRKKAQKRGQEGNAEGGFVEREAPLHVSKVMLADLFDEKKKKREGSKAKA